MLFMSVNFSERADKIGDKRECSGLLVHAFIYLSSFARIDLMASTSALFSV
jgi:hypothetical protein